ncbi:HNH endonuclease [Acaryochloris sp. 'Moss Beach']|uniref:HNH endonuclease n=1 Tax=Acaryochloris sp. 'Moss Beach' TaxID=2740837 RepID=UPI001F377A3B|nr:HNH endonuclease [Acaryochloris sp. 'Moss Beach']UJB70352.1 HNH endonuclease [Acaryochloris sp. 'Moss Beach']
MTRMETCLQLFNKMQGAKLRAHAAVNRVYVQYREQYQDWRQTPEARHLIKQQLQKLGDICPICQRGLAVTNSTIDHLEPKRNHISKTLCQENMLVMCWGCNVSKGTQPFVRWRRQLHPFRQQSLDYAIMQIHGEARLAELLEPTTVKQH